MIRNKLLAFPASSNQQAVWFHSQKFGTSYWNILDIKTYKGRLDLTSFRNSLLDVVEKHSSLRTNFKLKDQSLNQIIRNPSLKDFFTHEVFIEKSEREIKQIVDSEIEIAKSRELDYTNDWLFSFKVIEFEDIYFFILLINHIITDVTSIQLFWQELAFYYNQKFRKENVSLPRLCGQYYDYTLDQIDLKSTIEFNAQKDYWLKKLSGNLPTLQLNFSNDGFESKIQYEEIYICDQLKVDLRLYSLKKRVLFSSLFQLAYYILLYKYSRQQRILIGNVVSGRKGIVGKKANVMGLFAKRLVNILEISNEDILSDLLNRVNMDLLDTFKNADMSYEEIVREKSVNVKNSLKPLFQATFNMIKGENEDSQFHGLEKYNCFLESYINRQSQFNVNLFIYEFSKRVKVGIELKCISSYKPMVNILLRNFEQILKFIIYQPDNTVSDIIDNIPGDIFCFNVSPPSSSKLIPEVFFDFKAL